MELLFHAQWIKYYLMIRSSNPFLLMKNLNKYSIKINKWLNYIVKNIKIMGNLKTIYLNKNTNKAIQISQIRAQLIIKFKALKQICII